MPEFIPGQHGPYMPCCYCGKKLDFGGAGGSHGHLAEHGKNWELTCPCGSTFGGSKLNWPESAEHIFNCPAYADAVALLLISGGLYKPEAP